MTNRDGSTKLRNLRRVVEAAPQHRFHMRKFMEKTDCGTAYCAAGWAWQDPWFQRKGFPSLGKVKEYAGLGHTSAPVFETIDGVDQILANFFDITRDDSLALFALNIGTGVDPHAVSKEEVIANIDRLLAGQPAEPYAALEIE